MQSFYFPAELSTEIDNEVSTNIHRKQLLLPWKTLFMQILYVMKSDLQQLPFLVELRF